MTSVGRKSKRRQAQAHTYSAENSSRERDGDREFERAVANVERIQDPFAEVEQDVRLPSARGRPRQFDVVIRSRAAGREFMSVFEVQHRSRPVSLHDYQGWRAKAEGAGAARLACVAKCGFASTVSTEAAALDSRTDLITFNNTVATPMSTGNHFVEMHGLLAWGPAASIRAGDACILCSDNAQPLTLEDLVWTRNFEQGLRMHTLSETPSKLILVELASPHQPMRLTYDTAADIRGLTVAFKLVRFSRDDCIVHEAAYAAQDKEPSIWATHARVRAWETDVELTLATVKGEGGRCHIRQRLSTLSGTPLTRQLRNYR